MNDKDRQLLHQVHELVDQERLLRDQLSVSHKADQRHEDRAALVRVEEELDQCWDLLRQRRALQAIHRDPSSAHVRPVAQVENYLPLPAHKV